tara:strand:+ start:281 stop:772 length:492 start_codon:yes stop_codon:yes gene_type:complete
MEDTIKDINKEMIPLDLFTIKDRGYCYKLCSDGSMDVMYTLQISKKVYDFILKVNEIEYSKKGITVSGKHYYRDNESNFKCRYYIHAITAVQPSIKFIQDIEDEMYELKKMLMYTVRSNKIRLIQTEMQEIEKGDYVPKSYKVSKADVEDIFDKANTLNNLKK